MSITSSGVHEYNAEQCRSILSNLPDIFAAGLRFDHDQLVEIHVLASIERSPKQISRDIQSALFATYGIEVDHRIISIAQLPGDPFRHADAPADESAAADSAAPHEVRLMFNGIDASQKNGVFEANVYLACEERSCTGYARSRNTEMQRNRAVASATLDAINVLLDNDYYSLMDIKSVSISGIDICVTIVEFQEKPNSAPVTLIGAAVQQDSTPTSIVRSTLDALNRSFSKLYHSRTESNSI